MNLSPNTIWETLRNIKYEDIVHLYRTNRQFADVCRTPQAQAFFSYYNNNIKKVRAIKSDRSMSF